MLCFAPLHSTPRGSAIFRTFRNRREANGKSRKAAITAAAGKLAGVLNDVIATNADYREAASA